MESIEFFQVFIIIIILIMTLFYMYFRSSTSSSSSSSSSSSAAAADTDIPPLQEKQKIETYIDNRLVRGDEIAPALLEAIERSTISNAKKKKGSWLYPFFTTSVHQMYENKKGIMRLHFVKALNIINTSQYLTTKLKKEFFQIIGEEENKEGRGEEREEKNLRRGLLGLAERRDVLSLAKRREKRLAWKSLGF
ncbi:unnamed protein product [Prunus armeniaca]